ncbi:MAG TPA: hypothetical protein VGK33_15505 [Chloroflexota bacterium]
MSPRQILVNYSSLQLKAGVATASNEHLTGGRAPDGDTHGARLIERGRLLAALDRAVARKVTVVSAPAGSGKTSLLRA